MVKTYRDWTGRVVKRERRKRASHRRGSRRRGAEERRSLAGKHSFGQLKKGGGVGTAPRSDSRERGAIKMGKGGPARDKQRNAAGGHRSKGQHGELKLEYLNRLRWGDGYPVKPGPNDSDKGTQSRLSVSHGFARQRQ